MYNIAKLSKQKVKGVKNPVLGEEKRKRNYEKRYGIWMSKRKSNILYETHALIGFQYE